MRTFFCVALLAGATILLTSAENYEMGKVIQCACLSNATDDFSAAVSKNCTTDAEGKEVALILSPVVDCAAMAVYEDPHGQLKIGMKYYGELVACGERLADSTSGDRKMPYVEHCFSYVIDVEAGKIRDAKETPEPSDEGRKIRKREIMPLEEVYIKVTIKIPDRLDGDMKDKINNLIRKKLSTDYWLPMAFCFFDVTETE